MPEYLRNRGDKERRTLMRWEWAWRRHSEKALRLDVYCIPRHSSGKTNLRRSSSRSSLELRIRNCSGAPESWQGARFVTTLHEHQPQQRRLMRSPLPFSNSNSHNFSESFNIHLVRLIGGKSGAAFCCYEETFPDIPMKIFINFFAKKIARIRPRKNLCFKSIHYFTKTLGRIIHFRRDMTVLWHSVCAKKIFPQFLNSIWVCLEPVSWATNK